MITEDSNCLEMVCAYAPFIVIGPLQLGFAAFYLTYYINVSIVGGLILIIGVLFLLLATGKIVTKLRSVFYFFNYKNIIFLLNLNYFWYLLNLSASKKEFTSKRMTIIQEVIKNIKNIKLLGIGQYFEDKIKNNRM